MTEYGEELWRVYVTERPFELHLPVAIITGSADVILYTHDGEGQSLAIIDYKTSTDQAANPDCALQLAICANAGRREGLDVRAAYCYDLKSTSREAVDISPEAITASKEVVRETVHRLRSRDFAASRRNACLRWDVHNSANGMQPHNIARQR